MAHEWIIQTLQDLKDFAGANGLERIADKAQEALEVAQRELSEGRTRENGPPPVFFDPG